MQLATKNTLYNAYTFNTDLDESGRSNNEGITMPVITVWMLMI